MIAALVILSIASRAQNKKFEFEIGGGYGLSGLSGKIENGSIKPGMGERFTIGAKYFFTSKFGLGSECSFARYCATAKLSEYSAAITSVDDEKESFEYRIMANGIEEDINISAAEPALFFAYRQKFSDKIGMYGNVGLKMSVALSAKYQCTSGTIETRGYYPAYNVELYNMPNHGFGKVEDLNYSDNLETAVLNSIFVDAGAIIPVGKFGIQIGVYGSYGMNSLIEPEAKQLMIYPGEYQSVISLADQVSLISGGVNVTFQF